MSHPASGKPNRGKLDALRTFWTGLPSPISMMWSTFTFGSNVLLTAMVADYVFRARLLHPGHDLSMARIGYVSDSTASLLLREPDSEKTPITVRYARRECVGRDECSALYSENRSWTQTESIGSLIEQFDFTDTVHLSNLMPDTVYDWTTSNNHSGQFATAPRTGHTSTRGDTDGVYTFVHSSCLKNNFPYNPFRHSLSNQGLDHLGRALNDLKAQFMIFLGDFIYADVPRRHGTSVEDFRREYRQIYAGPDWAGASRNLPWIHVYDDHEIANDWDANTTGIFSAAIDPYALYHTSVNPPRVQQDETYFAFSQGPASFFLLDTRRYRSPNDATDGSVLIDGRPTKTMLGTQQLTDLLAWLEAPEHPGVRWKIVVSSVPFTRNWRLGARDTWSGYLGERQIILEAMWSAASQDGMGVVVLSGDRHEFAATAFPPPPSQGRDEQIVPGQTGRKVDAPEAVQPPQDDSASTRNRSWPASATVYEFSASPLNMFYLPLRTYRESSTAADYVSDVCIKYVPDGNSKFGAISIHSQPSGEESTLRYRLFVDGTERWNYTITAPAVQTR